MKSIYLLSICFVVLVSCKQASTKEKDAGMLYNQAMDALMLHGESSRPVAINLLNNAIELNPKDERLYRVVSSLMIEECQINDALEVLNKGIELNPTEADFWSKKALILNNISDSVTSAKQCYDRAISIYKEALLVLDADRESILFNLFCFKIKFEKEREGNVHLLRQIWERDKTLDHEEMKRILQDVRGIDID